MRKHVWTDERNARLTELWLGGTPICTIAAVLGRSSGAVERQSHNLSLPRRGSKRLPEAARRCECGDHAWIPLTQGFVSLMSPQDEGLPSGFLMSAYLCKSGNIYAAAYSRDQRKWFYFHHLLGIVEDHEEVDHKNQNGLDNRRENLRPASKSQNAANKRKYKGRSQYKGVAFYGADRRVIKRWTAKLFKDGKQHSLGYFLTEEEAAHAYDRAALEHFGEFARLNFPSGSACMNRVYTRLPSAAVEARAA